MKVIIAERVYDYLSDFPDGWKHISGDHYKFPVEIGNRSCFIKRFQKAKPEGIPGYDLMVRLKNKNEPNLARVFDVVQTKEGNKNVYYIFNEFLSGQTLEQYLAEGKSVDLVSLTNNLSAALKAVHGYHYWFTDLCEKNIFCEPGGRFSLIDLDSSASEDVRPDVEMRVNMEYWSLVHRFYKEILRIEEVKIADISGTGMNWLQLIFMVLHLQISMQQNVHRLTGVDYHGLPSRLQELSKSFEDLFREVLNKSRNNDTQPVSIDVRSLILEKILGQKDTGNSATISSAPVTLMTSDADLKRDRRALDRRPPVETNQRRDRRQENAVSRELITEQVETQHPKPPNPEKQSVNFILARSSKFRALTKFKVLAPQGAVINMIFQNFLTSYNGRNTATPILVRNESGEVFEWEFILRDAWYKLPRRADENKSITDNHVSAETRIFALRKRNKANWPQWNFAKIQSITGKPVIWIICVALAFVSFIFFWNDANKINSARLPFEYSVFAIANDSLAIVKNRRTKLFGYARVRDSSLFISCRLDSAFAFRSGVARAKFREKNIWIALDSSPAGYHVIRFRDDVLHQTLEAPIVPNRPQIITRKPVPQKNEKASVDIQQGHSQIDPKPTEEPTSPKETTLLVNMCTGLCDTKGIKGVEISFSDDSGKRYSFLSDGGVQEFKAPCDLFENGVNVSFRRSGKNERRNVRLKEFEIPELFKDPQY